MNIGYFRVSKEEEKTQDINTQIKAVFEKFKLDKKTLVLKERGTAYKKEKIFKRIEFLKLLEILFDAKKTNLYDVFLGNFERKNINFYVWDYHRIMRIFELNLLFSLLCDLYDINVFSYKQEHIKKKEDEHPIEKFVRYMLLSSNAFSSEEYSYTISSNVKKNVVKKEGNLTLSSKGNKWGKKIRDINGKEIKNVEIIEKIIRRIKYLILKYERNKEYNYYPKIIKDIEKKYKAKISKAYITKIKKNGHK